MNYAIVFLFFWSDLAYAAVEASALVRKYDDSKTQVTSPHVDVKGTFLKDRMNVSAAYAMDMVTSASSDVKSYASKAITDERKEYSGSLGMIADKSLYSVSYVNSQEKDYTSHTYAVGGSRDFFERNTTIGIGFAKGDDEIKSSADKNFRKEMENHTYSFSLTQVLTRNSVAQILYDLRVENGYLASPYRRARVKGESGAITLFPENHPRTRNRNSIALKYNYWWEALRLALATNTRFYFDSWGVNSVTVEERITRDIGSFLSLALNLRYYRQTSAKFYQDFYEGDPGAFYSGNKTLATYDSYLLGLRPIFLLSEKVKLITKAEYYIQNFSNHTDIGLVTDPSDDKKLNIRAFILGVGLEAKF